MAKHGMYPYGFNGIDEGAKQVLKGSPIPEEKYQVVSP